MEVNKFKEIFESCNKIQPEDDSNLFALECKIKDTNSKILFIPKAEVEELQLDGDENGKVGISEMVALTFLGGSKKEHEKYSNFLGKSIKDILKI